MKNIEKIIKTKAEKNQNKINWTKVWASKYPILKTYQKEVDIKKYAGEIRKLLDDIEKTYNYSKEDSDI